MSVARDPATDALSFAVVAQVAAFATPPPPRQLNPLAVRPRDPAMAAAAAADDGLARLDAAPTRESSPEEPLRALP